MRVVLADDVAHDARRFLVRLVVLVAEFTHRVEHAPVYRLEAVPDVREGTTDDDAHGVVEVRLPHLVFEIDRQDFARDFSHSERGSASRNEAKIVT